MAFAMVTKLINTICGNEWFCVTIPTHVSQLKYEGLIIQRRCLRR